MVFYRKYRPQIIEELDSSEVRDKLYSALKSSSVAHAFLFTGPKGLGKTSAARIVAKAVNCEKRWDVGGEKIDTDVRGRKTKVKKDQKISLQNPASSFSPPTPNVEPCNKCYQCISVTNGTNIDVLEIDAASNRGIDEIRDLREKVRLAPAASKKKVYIIDEVHMLTTEAFNALLKTLEEPPAHVIFILCTTEPHKVPATIASRCFHIPFKKATIEELARSFKRIGEIEKLKIEDEALKFIATLSDGSFRDGSKILEEMSSFNKKITKELVQEKYQIRQLPDHILEMIESLAKKDAKGGLQLASKLVDQGVDMKYFIEQLISELHQMLLVEVGVIENLELRTKNLELRIEEIKELVELLSRAYGELKYAVLPQLPLELAIVEWGLGDALRSPRQFNEVARGPVAPSSHPMSSVAGSLRALDGTPSSRATPRSSNVALKTSKSDSFWQDLIDKVKLYNHSIAGVLRGCGLKSYDKDKIVIETGYKFHKEKLEENNNLAVLKKVCSEIAGNKIEVSVVLKIEN